MLTQLLIARHGETLWNQSQRIQGQLDSDLTHNGIQQAQQLATRCRALAVDRIISSDLNRAQKTALICQQSLALPLTIETQLSERHFGQWQGQYFQSLQSHPEFDAIFTQVAHNTPPFGESAIDCQQRIHQALVALATKFVGQKLLVICHGEAMRCFLSPLIHAQLDSFNGKTKQHSAYQLFKNGDIVAVNYQHRQQKFVLEQLSQQSSTHLNEQ